jgi:succinate dehydrogenase / fumarate reductase cytochrome b subunit
LHRGPPLVLEGDGSQGPEMIMASHKRPISPHLQIYKPQLTSVMSILHRASGVFLSLGLPVLVWWLWSVADGPESYNAARELAASFIGRLLLLAWTAAFFYHLLNGIRHLAWDAGWGFELPVVYKTGWAAIAGAIALTLVAWLVGYWMRAG